MIRVEAEERRSTRLEPTGRAEEPIVSSVGDGVDSLDGLDWQTFSAAHFPGRRRHDLEALIAYGRFRRSHETARSSEEPARIGEGPEQSSTGLQDWESEGGAAH